MKVGEHSASRREVASELLLRGEGSSVSFLLRVEVILYFARCAHVN